MPRLWRGVAGSTENISVLHDYHNRYHYFVRQEGALIYCHEARNLGNGSRLTRWNCDKVGSRVSQPNVTKTTSVSTWHDSNMIISTEAVSGG